MSGDVPSVLASNESAKGNAGVKKPGIARKTEPRARTRTPSRQKIYAPVRVTESAATLRLGKHQ